MADTPNWLLLTGLVNYQGVPVSRWNRLNSALDAQVPPFERLMFGNGIYYGGIINADKTVGATKAWINGAHISMMDPDNAISGLTNGLVNYVWLTELQDVTVPDSPKDNVGQFSATTGTRPEDSKSVFLGTITLDLAGNVTGIERWNCKPNDTTKHGPEYIFPLMMRYDWADVDIGIIPSGGVADLTFNHAEGWYFRVPGAVIWWNLPEGWEAVVIDNSSPTSFRVLMYNRSGYTVSATAVRWLRWGLIRPAWTGGIWGRESYPWPGAGGILPIE